MKIRYITLFLVILFIAFGFRFIGGRPPSGGQACYEQDDDFSGTLAKWTKDSGTWSITSGVLQDDDTSDKSIRYSDSSLASSNMWVRVDITTEDYYTWGVVLRSPASASGQRYMVYLWGSNLYWTLWDSSNSYNTDIENMGAAAFDSGDVMGVTVTGTGASTVVRVWKNPTADCPSNAADWDSTDDSDWESTADCTTGSDCVDSNNQVGIFSSDTGNQFDNFKAGSF